MSSISTVEHPDRRPDSRSRPPVEEIRVHLHGMWASVASAWGQDAEYGDQRGAQMTERMLEVASPVPGERVLELACGAGGLGLAAAERVGPDGEVVISGWSFPQEQASRVETQPGPCLPRERGLAGLTAAHPLSKPAGLRIG
jgi:hypothetical protein